MIRLDEIGFYTISEKRAETCSSRSPIIRAELLVTNKCNLKCPYCRGIRKDWGGEMSFPLAQSWLNILGQHQLKNVRFSGGEPTLYPFLSQLIKGCVNLGVERIAISTNGTVPIYFYKKLIEQGVNDFSISLDSGCCATGEKMTGGIKGSWLKASQAIKELSRLAYVTVGIVFTEENVDEVSDTVNFIESLGPSDIRIIPSAQYNKGMELLCLKDTRLPILKYRMSRQTSIRGLENVDSGKCSLVLDDLAIYGAYHFPCVIYFREGGEPIGRIGDGFRIEREEWFKEHDSWKDVICRNNCLDVCKQYNNFAEQVDLQDGGGRK